LNEKQEKVLLERMHMRNGQHLLEKFLKLKQPVQFVLALCVLVLIIGVIGIIVLVGFIPTAGSFIISFIAGVVGIFFIQGVVPSAKKEMPPTKKDAND
jgi:hypothetical protein